MVAGHQGAGHQGLEDPALGLAGAAQPGVLFPGGYTWLVFAGSLDIIMTYVMLTLGAVEVNMIANMALGAAGLWGLIALKFAAVVVVLAICEYVGRRRHSTALSLIRVGVAFNFLPVAASVLQLAVFYDDWLSVYLGI